MAQQQNAGGAFDQKDKEKDVRLSNIVAARAVADAVRTSLGPRGMDKMIVGSNKEVMITNDGATILKKMELLHPASKMLVDLSHAQDVEAGDGTTTVVVLAGALLAMAQRLLERGIHPTVISDSFHRASLKAMEIIDEMATPVVLSDRETLLRASNTSLNSKVVSQYSSILSPIAVDAVLHVTGNLDKAVNVDLNDIRVVKKLGKTIDDSELVDGLIFTQRASKAAGGPARIEKAKIGLIQFQLSPPKTDMEQQVVVSEYSQMDRILREERKYVLDLCKKIKAAGCTVLLIQKSVLRDAVSELALHFLAKMKIMVVRDIERDEVEFITKTLHCLPIASIDGFVPEKFGLADLVEEEPTSGGSIVRITGIQDKGQTATILVRGSNKLVIDEAERSIHDALCVVRSLVKKRALVPGGGAPETQISVRLEELSRTMKGTESICISGYSDAFEIIPSTLAENGGLQPIEIVTALRNIHKVGNEDGKKMGICVRKGTVTDMIAEKVVQPALVSLSAVQLATETVRMILKIDDIVVVN